MASTLPISTALLAIFGLSPFVHGETLTVGQSGSGADFDSVQEAVLSAQPGDVILVASGTYSGAIQIDKALTILGAGSETTTLRAFPSGPADIPLPLMVQNLGAGEEVRVGGLTLQSVGSGTETAAALTVDSCAGPVAVFDLVGVGGNTPDGPSSAVRVVNSAQVAIHDCAFEALPTSGDLPAIPALIVESSIVSVSNSRLEGGAGPPLVLSSIPNDGAPALVMNDSTVRMADSTLLGGAGVTSGIFGPPMTVTNGAAAIEATGSTVFIRGRNSELIGGQGGVALIGGKSQFGKGGSALLLDTLSNATATPLAILSPGANGDDIVTTPPHCGRRLFCLSPSRTRYPRH